MRTCLVVTVAVLTAACAGSPASTSDEPLELRASVVHEGLVGPTQLLIPDSESFVVATINGGENDRKGQVVRIDRQLGSEEVLVADLDKPTGIALIGDDLWIMEADRLTRGPIGGDRIVVAADLPNNGRSEGTLTLTPDGLVLFNTSGSKRGSEVVEGSGRLFTVDPSTNTIEELASGFKHAYAHAFDQDQLWSVEMTDGSFDGRPAPDELVLVDPSADHGWPQCVGNNRAIAEFGGEEGRCSRSPASQALFEVSATPTSVVLSPFNDGELLVALWREGRIVSVPTEPAGLEPHEPTEVLGGLENPQHVVSFDGELYLTEFGTGSILQLAPS